MSDILLSIVVPVYNMAADGKLNFCIDSLLNQTVAKIGKIELILVDDKSTDDSLKVLREYEAKYSDIVKVIAQPENGRQGKAKNTGIEVASGEWIGFIDSDDWVTPDFYERLIVKAKETGADVVGAGMSQVTSHTYEVGKLDLCDIESYVGILDETKYKAMILGFNFLVGKIYKREVLLKNGLRFPEYIFYEDNCAGPLWPLYFTHYEKIPEPLYYYYQHSESTVHSVTESKCLDRMKSQEILLAEMKKRGLYEKYKDEIEIRFAEMYFIGTLFSYMLGAKRRKYSFVKQMVSGIKKEFPNFQKNKYYYSRVKDLEERKMIKLAMNNSLAFFIYYSLLWKYRNMKAK